MSELLDLKARVALVTGAGQGIGRQVALHFANHNGRVIVNDFVLDRAEAVVAELKELGADAVALQGDVTDLESVREVVAKGTEALGVPSILVNNAGSSGATPTTDARQPFWETGPEAWDSFIRVNFYGVINCVTACLPGMVAQKYGRIVTVISDAGRMGDSGLEVYAGAKAGAAGFSRAIARTLGRHLVTANCVSIAATLTPNLEARLKADPERLSKMMQKYVIRRPGRADDVANMVLYLASDAAEWITGQTYPVNGGYTFSL